MIWTRIFYRVAVALSAGLAFISFDSFEARGWWAIGGYFVLYFLFTIILESYLRWERREWTDKLRERGWRHVG